MVWVSLVVELVVPEGLIAVLRAYTGRVRYRLRRTTQCAPYLYMPVTLLGKDQAVRVWQWADWRETRVCEPSYFVCAILIIAKVSKRV
jgi:hypothetical protein